MDISSSLFYNNEELKRVDLTNGKSSIPSQLFIPLPKVEWLSLDGNFIPVLTPLLLRKKKKLEYLTMAECEIEAVLDSTFHEAKSLQILIMRNNNIKYLTAGQLKGLESLQHIGENKTIHDSAKNCNISLWFTRPMRKTWTNSNSLFQIWAVIIWNQLVEICLSNRHFCHPLIYRRIQVYFQFVDRRLFDMNFFKQE